MGGGKVDEEWMLASVVRARGFDYGNGEWQSLGLEG